MKTLPILPRVGWLWLLLLFWATGATAQFIAPALKGCAGGSAFYQMTPHPNSTYAWTVSPGGTLNGTAGLGNTVQWGGPGIRTITVVESLFPTGTSTYTATVTVEDIPKPLILPSFAPDCPPKDKPDEDQQEGKMNISLPQINDDPCPKACENMTITYSTPATAGHTYQWTVWGTVDAPLPTTGTGPTITVTWGPAGMGLITVVETTGPPSYCSGSTSTCVEIIPSPVAAATGNGVDLAVSPVYICVGQEVSFNHSGTVGGTSYEWFFGDGTSSTEDSPVHEYGSLGTFYGYLVVKNACGCEDVVKFEVIVKEGIVPSLGCISTVCIGSYDLYNVAWPGMENCPNANIVWTIHGGSVVSFPNGPNGISVQVLWDDNDGFINQNGYGAIEVIVDGCDGVCVSALWAEVPVIHQTAISGITNACVGEVFTYSIPYQPGISPGNVNGVDFAWHITPAVGGSGGIVNVAPLSNEVEIRWSTPGDYTISIDMYYNDLFTQTHCLYTPTELVVHVLPNLEIKPALSYICLGDGPPSWTAVVAGTNTGATAPLTWTLQNPGGTVIYTQTGGALFTFPAATITAAGNYGIRVNSPNYCANGGYANLKVYALPTATGTITGKTAICANQVYNYTTNAIPPAGTVLKWVALGGAVGQLNGPATTVIWGNAPSAVQLWVVDLVYPRCSSLVASLPVSQYVPAPNFTGLQSLCVNSFGPYSITNLFNYTDLQWSVSPATSGTVTGGQGTATVNVQFLNNAGPCNLICAAKVCGSWVNFSYPITLNPQPVPTFNAVGAQCQGQPVLLGVTTTGSVSSIDWNFGDGTTATGGAGTTVSHVFGQFGSFPVTATIHYSTCNNITLQTSGTVVIDPKPVGYLSYPNGNVICTPITNVNLVVSMVNPPGPPPAYTYAWSAGVTPNNAATGNVTNFGDYTVTITDVSTGCTLVLTAHVVDCGGCPGCNPVNSKLTFTVNSSNCGTACFTRTNVPSTFHSWNFGDGTSSTNPALTQCHTYAHAGYFQVVLFSTSPKVSDPSVTCLMKDIHQVVVHLVPDFIWQFSCAPTGKYVKLIDFSEVLPGEPVTGWAWNWAGPTTGSSSLQSPNPLLAPGNYSVTLTATNIAGSCIKIKTFTVPPVATPAISYSAPKPCEAQPYAFSGSAPGGTNVIGWNWSFSDGSSSALQNFSKTFNAPPTSFTVTLTAKDEWGCTASATTTVNVFDHSPTPAIVSAPNPPTVCQGSPVSLSLSAALTPTTTYKWFEAQNIGTVLGTASTFAAYQSGLYGVSLTDGNGCDYVSTMATPVKVLPAPSALFYSDPPKDLKTDYCMGELIHISVFGGENPGGYSYNWTVNCPGGFIITAPTQTISNISSGSYPAGTYLFTVTVTDNTPPGCSTIGTFTLEVHDLPTVDDIIQSTNCPPAILTAISPTAIFYNWSNGNTGNPITANTGGTYFVTVTDQFGCTAKNFEWVDYIPDLGNLMVGCYEFCHEVKWQAPVCFGCQYDWYQSGTYIGSGATYPITESGVYNLLVTSLNGCTAYSDDIEINLMLDPEDCFNCDVEVEPIKLNCIGTDPVTGWPMYSFSFDYVNHGATLAGLFPTVYLGTGTVFIADPPTGMILGGGASGTISGTIVSPDPNLCFNIIGLIDLQNGSFKECLIFDQCIEFPDCGGEGCNCEELQLQVFETPCANGYYHIFGSVNSFGCDFKVIGGLVKTPGGKTYPMSNLQTTYSGGQADFNGFILAEGPGVYCFTIFVEMADGTICKVQSCKVIEQDCSGTSPCNVATGTAIECLEMGPLGRHFSIGFNFMINTPGCAIWIQSVQGLTSNLNYTSVGGNYFGTVDFYSLNQPMGKICFKVLFVCNGLVKCEGKFCIEVPPGCGTNAMVGRPGQAGQFTVIDAADDQIFVENDQRSTQPTAITDRPIIAPNPASELVEARFMAPGSDGATLSMTDLNGKSVVDQPVGPLQTSVSVSVRSLPAGVYVLSLRTGDGVRWRERLVIVH